MSPVVLVVMLAVQMLLLAGFLHLLGQHRRAAAQGLKIWGGALLLFACACALRWAAGVQEGSPLVIPGDTLLVLAVLLFVAGADAYLERRSRLTPRTILWLAGWFASAHLLLLLLAGAQGRHVLLNLCLGALHAVLAWQAYQLKNQAEAEAKPPAALVAFGVGGLALLALLRAFGGGLALLSEPHDIWFTRIDFLYAAVSATLLLLWVVLWLGWKRWVLR